MSEPYSTTTSLIPFQYGEITFSVHMDEDGEPWFVGTPTAEILGYANPRQALSRLDADEKGVYLVDTPGGTQEMVFISEAGLYNLILRSRRPEAKEFKRWVTHDVLPQIRKTGTYVRQVPASQPPTFAMQVEDLRACATFLAELGIFDDRDKLMLADIARTSIQQRYLLPPGGLVAALPSPQGFFLAERVTALGYRLSRKEEATLLASGLARHVAAEYRHRYGEKPSQSQRFVDGAVRPVNWYRQQEAEWIDALIQAACAHRGFTRHAEVQ